MSASHKRVVLLDDPDYQLEDGAFMEFRLTYAGPLYSTRLRPLEHQRDTRADHKHSIRKVFHKQLKKLWEVYPSLRQDIERPIALGANDPPNPPKVTIEDLAAQHAMYGFNFVPLVTDALSLLCAVEILMLRDNRPGSIVEGGEYGGDLDNRIKTLLDALSIPSANESYHSREVGEEESPFFCLLENDKLITKVSVETDHLLEEIDPKVFGS